VIYLTHTRLMRESERTVHEAATRGTTSERRTCRQLVADRGRYTLWYARHDQRMLRVGRLLRQRSQLLDLRRACVEQVHRAALVRYMRDFQLPSEARERTLHLFYGVTDPREATLLEHRSYLMAASSQLCATRLLALAGDVRGIEIIGHYQRAYAEYFGLFCERARRAEARQRCLLGELFPEIEGVATRLRERILSGDLLPSRTFAVTRRRRAPASLSRV